MARRRKSKTVRPPDVEAIMRGDAVVDIAQLMGLIHQVNPTGRGLSGYEQARRYEIKNRLQGLLIQKFAHDLEVGVDPGNEAVVSIHRRNFPDDATHAVLADLDEDSRSWVLRVLDEATYPDEGEAPIASLQRLTAGARDTLLEQGLTAMEEYDYELAQTCLLAALEKSRGGVDEARALLNLLVEHLAAFDDALAIERALSTAARSDPSVRLHLALAAASTADGTRALRLMDGLSGPQTATVWTALVQRSLQDGDCDQAERFLAELHRHAPDSRSLGVLEDRLRTLRDQKKPDLIEAMARAWDRGDVDGTARGARDILDRWPGTTEAQQVIARIEEMETAGRRQALLEDAAEAYKNFEYARAIDLWQKGLELGADPEVVKPLVARAVRRHRGKIDDEQVTEVLQQLGSRDIGPGLLGYTALRPQLRERVRGASDLPHLDWLERIGVSESDIRNRAAVAAVVALVQAMPLGKSGDVLSAAKVLGAHVSVVRELPEVREILGQAAEVETREREAHIIGEIERVRAALAADDWETASSAIASLDVLPRSDEQCTECNALREKLETGRHRAQLADAYHAAMDEGDLDSAWQPVHELYEISTGEEREHWLVEKDRLMDELHQLWKYRRLDGAGAMPPFFDFSIFDLVGSNRWQMPDEDSWVVAQAREHYIVLLVFDSGGASVRTRVMLRIPLSMGRVSTTVAGETIWIVGSMGNVLGLDATSLRIRVWYTKSQLSAKLGVLRQIEIAPGGRYLWFATGGTSSEDSRECTVVDLESWTAHRRIARGGRLVPICSASGPTMAVLTGEGEAIHLFESNGTPASMGTFSTGQHVIDITVHPDGKQLVLMLAGEPRSQPDSPTSWVQLADETPLLQGNRPVFLATLTPKGEVTGVQPVREADIAGGHALATSFDTSMILAKCGNRDGRRWLVAWRPHGDSFAELWRVPITEDVALAHGSIPRRVRAVWVSDGHARAAELGLAAPAIPRPSRDPSQSLPLYGPGNPCRLAVDATRPEYHEIIETLMTQDIRQRRMWIPGFKLVHKDDPDALWRLAWAESYACDDLEVLTRAAQETRVAHPDHAGFATLRAHEHAHRWDWADVYRILENVEVGDLEPPIAQHMYHLRAMALLWLDRPEQARVDLEKGLAIQGGGCGLQSWLDLLVPLPSPLAPEHWDKSQPVLRQILGAIHIADAALERGDHEATITALDRPAIWKAGELQTAARRAMAYLALPDIDDEGEFGKTLALATFRRLRAGLFGDPGVPCLPVPGASIGLEEIDAIAMRCWDWLTREDDSDVPDATQGRG